MPQGKRYPIQSRRKGKLSQRKSRKRYPMYRNLPLGGFPDKQIARLKYVDLITMNATSSGSAVPLVVHFRANSLYDPDLSSSGHQPRGFDELSAIYDHYCVIGSKITVHFENHVDNIQSAGQYCFLMLQDTNSTPTSLIDIMENGDTNKVSYKQRNSTTSRNVTLTKRFSPYKLFGISKKDSLVNNVNLNAQVTQNPAEDAIYTIGIACQQTTSTDPPPMIVRVEIEYLAIFTEKRQMASS